MDRGVRYMEGEAPVAVYVYPTDYSNHDGAQT